MKRFRISIILLFLLIGGGVSAPSYELWSKCVAGINKEPVSERTCDHGYYLNAGKVIAVLPDPINGRSELLLEPNAQGLVVGREYIDREDYSSDKPGSSYYIYFQAEEWPYQVLVNLDDSDSLAFARTFFANFARKG